MGIRIDETLEIPEQELVFTASRSGGPGGQHVNKVSTRVTVRFDVTGSPTLSEGQKARILRKLPTRTSRDGVLRVVCGRHRSQAANREEAVQRFVALLRDALRRRRRRVPTRVPASEKERRVQDKRLRARIKRQRQRPDGTD